MLTAAGLVAIRLELYAIAVCVAAALVYVVLWPWRTPRHRRPRQPPRLGEAKTPVQATLPSRFTLHIELAPNGTWHITTDAHRGFMISVPTQHPSLAEALASVPETLRDLLRIEPTRRDSKELP